VKIAKDSWVRIEKVILEPGARAPQIPEDTKRTPLKMWVKGHLQADAKIGDTVSVKTRVDRLETGVLLCADQGYELNYGRFVPELLSISEQVRDLLDTGDDEAAQDPSRAEDDGQIPKRASEGNDAAHENGGGDHA
jgi:hypothetical protein